MLKDDVLKGAREIGAYIGEPERRVFHLVNAGHIPTFRIGATIHARKSELDRRFSANSIER